MSPENFTYWLQGFFEISGKKELSALETQIIIDHLNLVFDKKTTLREVGVGLLDTKFTGVSSDLLC